MSDVSREGSGTEPMPARVGPYRLLHEVGRGGMGVVYVARHDKFEQRVAVKVIKLGMDSAEVLARFEIERQALARMDHHNIARVLDAGVADDGRPWFAMEYVPGLPLLRYCDEHRLPVGARLELFLQVCDAVQHAHQKGVIHRDLTPRNILVREENDRPVPKVIDFGLARAMDLTGLNSSVFTEPGRILGTPEYMSPEQAGASPLDIDSRTDVYSLGAVLYELLVGEQALDSRALREAGLAEMQRCIREVEPTAPSVRIAEHKPGSELHARERSTTTERLRRIVSRDLDWITLKALEKDRLRRYPTVQSLADDIRNHLRGDPVVAGPPSVRYRLGKWVARHRVLVAATSLVFASLLAGLVSSLLLWQQAEAARLSERLTADQAQVVFLQRFAAELWPAHRRRLRLFDDWLARARDVSTRRDQHRQRLQALQTAATASPWTLELAQEAAAFFDRLVAPADSGDPCSLAWQEQRRAAAVATPVRTAAAVDERWRRLQAELAGDHRFAGVVVDRVSWLLPLGADPVTKLQEFLVDGSGREPQRGRDGGIHLDPEDGIVLVLLPPGECWIGSQSKDPKAPRWFQLELPAVDGQSREAIEALPNESCAGRPVRLRLDAFLIGKYEVTRGQWQRLSGRSPGQFATANSGVQAPDPIESWQVPLRPVESVSFDEAALVLARVGLTIPTEGQWEYACRAGTEAVWPWGDDVHELGKHANFADVVAHARGLDYARCVVAERLQISDGFVRPAPVGTYLANAFGLYDMLGNVAEWTAGRFTDDYSGGMGEGDGLVEKASALGSLHCIRGGSWTHGLEKVRPSARIAYQRDNASSAVGVRAALRLPLRED